MLKLVPDLAANVSTNPIDQQRQQNTIEIRLGIIRKNLALIAAEINGTGGTGAAATIGSAVPLPVAPVASHGIGGKASDELHQHKGVASAAVFGNPALYGDIVLVASGLASLATVGNQIQLTVPIPFEETLTDSGDHINYTFAASYTAFVVFVDGQKMRGGGIDYSYAAPTVTFVSARHATSLVDAVVFM